MGRYASYVPDFLVSRNPFRGKTPAPPPALPPPEQARALLPIPAWDGHPEAAACWEATWNMAFANLRAPMPGSGFISPFIDTAFNGNLFMWDSAFILMFGRYGRRAFDFQQTLDNFYALQHPDGFICREIRERDGTDCFDRFDPSATGPNLMPWAEWTHYRHTADRARLAAVLPALLAYHHWFRKWRTWPDGSYWATGWACGMDNQPRMEQGCVAEHDHGHMTWIDTCLQQALSCRILRAMNHELGRPWPVDDVAEEQQSLDRLVNGALWDEETGFYYDRYRGGALSGVKTVGSFWALVAGLVPDSRLGRFLAHLEDPRTFCRPHRVPSLSADNPLYRPGGDYWRGSVWAPTNYMVLEGLAANDRPALAHTIARNHLANVYAVFGETGTLWENYAPESASRGEQSARDFVGWSGLPPIAVLLEHVFGLRPDAPRGVLRWDVRLTEAHGVTAYPWGSGATMNLQCARRDSVMERPRLSISATAPVDVEVRWDGGRDTMHVPPTAPKGV